MAQFRGGAAVPNDAFDSVTHFSRMVFEETLARQGVKKDTFAAYNMLATVVIGQMQKLFDQKNRKNAFIIAQEAPDEEGGVNKRAPLFAGKKTGLEVTHIFDLVRACCARYRSWSSTPRQGPYRPSRHSIFKPVTGLASWVNLKGRISATSSIKCLGQPPLHNHRQQWKENPMAFQLPEVFDASKVDISRGPGGLPIGVLQVAIKESEILPAKDQQSRLVLFTLKILAGAHAGREGGMAHQPVQQERSGKVNRNR